MSEVVKILKKARALVKKGWVQEAPKIETSRGYSYCALGALREVNRSLFVIDTIAYAALLSACPEDSVATFNDAPTTKKRDVLEMFDVAIATAEEAGL
jgi:hypothetical protein